MKWMNFIPLLVWLLCWPLALAARQRLQRPENPGMLKWNDYVPAAKRRRRIAEWASWIFVAIGLAILGWVLCEGMPQ